MKYHYTITRLRATESHCCKAREEEDVDRYRYVLLVWPTQLDPALRTLYVCVYVFVCVFPSEVMTPLFGVMSSNVELRNYVISRHNYYQVELRN